jgi:hypothetical protein
MRWRYIIIGLVLLALLLGGADVVERLTTGPRVGRATNPGNDGIIRIRPEELAAAAGVDAETYALARMMSSEHQGDPNVYLRAVGWAVRNKAAERGVSVLRLLTDGAGDAGDGYFGEQKAGAGTKYASTARDPYRRHIEVATEIVQGFTPDLTTGATHFFSPKAQDALAARAARGDAAYVKYLGKDAAFIFASWASPGKLYPTGAVPVVPDGIDGRVLTLWRRA